MATGESDGQTDGRMDGGAALKIETERPRTDRRRPLRCVWSKTAAATTTNLAQLICPCGFAAEPSTVGGFIGAVVSAVVWLVGIPLTTLPPSAS